jgi:predicted fused transcriptional regulator/phosphomethylpyrimidine kinase
MRDSQNCILCTNGRHLSNAILNVKYSKEEFEKRKKEILSSYEKIEAAKREFEKLKSESIVKYSFQTKCHNVTGNYLHNCFDGVRIFDAVNTRNSSYVADVESPTDCMDCNNIYYKPEFCYDLMGVLQCSKSKHSVYIMYCNESEYCDSCYHSNNLFGCIRLNKDSYSILNKKYEKEEYEKLRKEIIESMKRDGSYGQFFPPSMSPFGYNETLSKEYFPLTRDEALAKGFRWQEQNTGTFGKETIDEDAIPKSIDAIQDSIVGDILACNECGKNFKITQMELDFYKRMGIPLPHKDFECRHQDRMKRRNPRALWERSCMCANEGHINHKSNICAEKFETSYAPDRKEIVYCESCYQQEVS